MKLLLDTQLLIWTSTRTQKLSAAANQLINQAGAQLCFSVASIWEIAIKFALKKPDFTIDPAVLRQGLLKNGWEEVQVMGEHAIATSALPPVHKDPFDRLIVAQAQVEGLTLLTVDKKIAQYPGAIQKV